MTAQEEELFDRYLMGHLSEKEKNDFLEEIYKDEKLAETFKVHQAAYFAINFQQTEKTKGKLVNWHNESLDNERTSALSISQLYGIAASIVLLLVASLIIYLNWSNVEDQYYSPMPNIVEDITRGGGQEIPDLNEAMVYYDNSNYIKAQELLEDYLNHDIKAPVYTLYLAICHYENGNYSEAEKLYGSLISKDHYKLSEASQWYLTFALLKQDKTEEALQNLNVIINQNGIYAKQANGLLSELE